MRASGKVDLRLIVTGWRELLAGPGVAILRRLAGSGVFRDAGTDERGRGRLFFDGLTPAFQNRIPVSVSSRARFRCRDRIRRVRSIG